MIVLDTNVVSELMRPAPEAAVQRWLAGLGAQPLVTTAVTVAEITFGLERLPHGARRADLETRFAALAASLNVIAIDDRVARIAGAFMALRQTQRAPATLADMLIAGAASTLGATLATRNETDFAGLPLVIANPWAR